MYKIAFVACVVLGALGAWLLKERSWFVPAPVLPTTTVLDAYDAASRSAWSGALAGAQRLRLAIGEMLVNPQPETLERARRSWVDAQREFARAAVSWELVIDGTTYARLAAWPVDEGLFDYVDRDTYSHNPDNPLASINMVRNEAVVADGLIQNMKPVRTRYLVRLAEAVDFPGFAPTGLHALEFLLWGQGAADGSAGKRPHTEFGRDEDSCTGYPRTWPERKLFECTRRTQLVQALAEINESYLQAVVKDLNGLPTLAYREAGPDYAMHRLITILATRLRELADRGLSATTLVDQPNEFSGELLRYLRDGIDAVAQAWTRGGAESSLRGWAFGRDKDRARGIDKRLEGLRVALTEHAPGRRDLLAGTPAADSLRTALMEAAQGFEGLAESQLKEPGGVVAGQ